MPTAPSSPNPNPPAVSFEKMLEHATIDRDCLPAGSPVGSFVLREVVERDDFSVFYRATASASDSEVVIEEYWPSALSHRNPEGELTVREKGFAPMFSAGLEAFVEESEQLAVPLHPALVIMGPVWRLRQTAYRLRLDLSGVLLTEHLDVRDRPPDERWLRALAEPLLGALGSLHDAGRMHGNVRPGNIALQGDGVPLLLEFGAARAAVSRLAPWLAVALEPDFAAPELQLYGSVAKPAADLYSLAAVLLFCMTGEVPAPARGGKRRAGPIKLAPLLGELQRRHPSLRYSEPWVATLERALAFSPEDRPQSVTEFLDDLARPPAMAAAAPIPPVQPVQPTPPAAADASVTPPTAPAPPNFVAPAERETPRPASPVGRARVAESPLRPVPEVGPAPGDARSGVEVFQIDLDDREPAWQLPAMLQIDDSEPLLIEPLPPAERNTRPPPLQAAPAPTAPLVRASAAPKAPRWPWLVGAALVGAAAMLVLGLGVEQLAQDLRLASLALGISSAPSPDEAASASAASGSTERRTTVASGSVATPANARAAAVGGAVGSAVVAGEAARKRGPADVRTGPASANTSNSSVPLPKTPAGSTATTARGPTAGSASVVGSAPLAGRPLASTAPRQPAEARPADARQAAGRKPSTADPAGACAPRTNFSLYLCMKTQCELTQFYAHPQCVALRREDAP